MRREEENEDELRRKVNLTVKKTTCEERLRERAGGTMKREKSESSKATSSSMRIFNMHASAVFSLFPSKMMNVLVITASPSL